MKKYEELFYLIQSLTKSEKRYFKLEHQKKDAAVYLLVFDAIDKQAVYDEAMLKEQFKDEDFVRQFTTIKNYIKEKLLSSLRRYHSKLSVQAELMDIMRNVEILYNKGLYELCKSELQRAEKKAIRFELNTMLIQIIDWKRKIHQTLFPQDWNTIQTITEQQKELLEISVAYTDLILTNIDPTQYSIPHKPINNIHNSTLYELSVYQKLLKSGQIEAAGQRLKNLLSRWEERQELQIEHATTYCSITNTYLAFLIFSKQYDLALQKRKALSTFTASIQNHSASLIKEILRSYNIELEIFRTQQDFTSGIILKEEIVQYLDTHFKKIPKNYILSFRYQFAHLHFLNQEYKTALKWVNLILNEKDKQHREDLITYTNWLNLLIHFELKNVFVLRYYVDATKRHLKKSKSLEAYERILLNFLSKAIDLTSKRELIDAFLELEAKLKKEKIPSSVLDYIDFVTWAHKKTLQKP